MNTRLFTWLFVGVCTGTLLVPCTSSAGGDHRSPRARNLVAEAEIAKLPVTYAWAVDAKNIDKMMTIFSEDAVYDLSAYGYPNVEGLDAIRDFFLYAVFPSEQCSFSSISNIRVDLDGRTGSGADYFIHFGYNNPRFGPNTRNHVEGQHFYEFKKERGRWKISYMVGHPTFDRIEDIDPAELRHCP